MVTGVCFQWRDSGSYDSEVQIETFVLRRKFCGKIATEQQPPIRYQQALQKDNNRMKLDSKTYFDKKKELIEMTADHTIRPNKVLFFADTHFLFFKCSHTLHTLSSPTSQLSNQSLPKSAILLTHKYE